MPGTFAKDPEGHQGFAARKVMVGGPGLFPGSGNVSIRGTLLPIDAESFSPQRFLGLEGWGPSLQKRASRTFILDSLSSEQCGWRLWVQGELILGSNPDSAPHQRRSEFKAHQRN